MPILFPAGITESIPDNGVSNIEHPSTLFSYHQHNIGNTQGSKLSIYSGFDFPRDPGA